MLNNLLTKLKNILPENEIKEQEKEVLIRKYSNWNNELDEKVYSKVENSFNKGKTIQIGYFDMGSAEINKREIDVYHKTRRYVIGYCHLRKAMRKFRTSRIISAKITDKSYQIPQDFDKNEY